MKIGREKVVNMNEQLNKYRTKVIETIAQNINLYGITPSIGRLYGALYFSDEPLTLDDMANITGMSKTSMSTAIRTLADLKMVDKVWKKGVRKDLYVVQGDWYQTFTDLFTIKWRRALSVNINVIEKSLAQLEKMISNNNIGEEMKKIVEADIQKLTYALEYYDWLDRLIDSFETKEIFDYVPKERPIDYDED